MRTVRSAASARNRPRPRLAWLLLLILVALITLTARIAAAAPVPAELDAEDLDELEEMLDSFDERDDVEASVDEVIDDALREHEEVDIADPSRPIEQAPLDPDLEPPSADPQRAERAATTRRRSGFGRIEVSVIYRRTDPIAASRRDEIWLLGTWKL